MCESGIARILFRIAVISGFTLSLAARAAILVDCTGVNTTAYPSITAALAAATTPIVGANVQVIAGPCTETVNISNRYNLNLGAQLGKTIALNGKIVIANSANVYVYGLNVSNSSSSGIVVTVSRGVTLDTVSSSNNKKHGLAVAGFSDVELFGPATFQNNGAYGARVEEQAAVDIDTTAGALTVNNNGAGGFFIYNGSGLTISGTATIENNGSGGIGHQAGIAVHETSSLQLNDCTGNNLIQGNVNPGIEVQGGSTASMPACGAGFTTLIQNNGNNGIAVLLSSEMVINGEAQISGSPQAGVFVDGAASLYLNGPSLITNNGTAGNIETGGVLIGNGSALEAHHAQVNSNNGFGFIGFLGGNLNIDGTTATGNEFGIVGCDSSAWLTTDFPLGPPAIICAVAEIPSLGSPVKPLNGARPAKPLSPKLMSIEPPDPAAIAEKVTRARVGFWKAMTAPAAGPR
jgi:hypothetical protein